MPALGASGIDPEADRRPGSINRPSLIPAKPDPGQGYGKRRRRSGAPRKSARKWSLLRPGPVALDRRALMASCALTTVV
jgi:hypothetical protein